MACFLIPLAQAVVTSAYRKFNSKSISESAGMKHHIPALEKMLWGGSVMLIVDHILSGELSWKFPFFTAFNEVGGAEVFFRELLGVGVPMSLAISVVWAVYTFVKMRRPAVE